MIPGLGNPLEKGKATHSSILAWRIPWAEESGGLQSMGSESDTEAGRDWGQEEKGMTEDEMAGWHHRLDGHEFE